MATSTFIPALVVVDMQHDFVHGSLAVPDAPSIIPSVNALLESKAFVIKVGTKDWHPSNHISFADTHKKEVFSTITIFPPGKSSEDGNGLEQVLWPVHCVASTPGSEFVEGLHFEALDHIVVKGTHPGIECYSAFNDPWGTTSTDLRAKLLEHGVTDVFFVGLATDFCVKFSAIDAAVNGFKSWVVKDSVRSVSDTGEEWKALKEGDVRVISQADLIDMLVNV